MKRVLHGLAETEIEKMPMNTVRAKRRRRVDNAIDSYPHSFDWSPPFDLEFQCRFSWLLLGVLMINTEKSFGM